MARKIRSREIRYVESEEFEKDASFFNKILNKIKNADILTKKEFFELKEAVSALLE